MQIHYTELYRMCGYEPVTVKKFVTWKRNISIKMSIKGGIEVGVRTIYRNTYVLLCAGCPKMHPSIVFLVQMTMLHSYRN